MIDWTLIALVVVAGFAIAGISDDIVEGVRLKTEAERTHAKADAEYRREQNRQLREVRESAARQEAAK